MVTLRQTEVTAIDDESSQSKLTGDLGVGAR
jgi:hypothetical protein